MAAVLKLTAVGPTATASFKTVCEKLVVGKGQEKYLRTETDKNPRSAFRLNLLNMFDNSLIRTGFEGRTEELEEN